MGDKARFKAYLAPRLARLLGGAPGAADTFTALPFGDKAQAIEDILYEHHRCNLAHEGALPANVIWRPDPSPTVSTAITFGGGDTLTLRGAWFDLLALAALDRMPTGKPRPYLHAYRPVDDVQRTFDVLLEWYSEPRLELLIEAGCASYSHGLTELGLDIARRLQAVLAFSRQGQAASFATRLRRRSGTWRTIRSLVCSAASITSASPRSTFADVHIGRQPCRLNRRNATFLLSASATHAAISFATGSCAKGGFRPPP